MHFKIYVIVLFIIPQKLNHIAVYLIPIVGKI